MGVDEKSFEDAIEGWLLEHGGYLRSEPSSFDAAVGLDTAETFAFIGATQGDEWERLVALYGGDRDAAQAGFRSRLAHELDARGTVDVLRHGIVDKSREFRLAYFRPAHGLTPELVERYDANRVTVTRQLPYETGAHKTIDLCLLVNGIPVATAELKNRLTGQTVEDGKRQYRTDRDPANVTVARRAVVHFAVDSEEVAMTTRLAGGATRFLPFNRGREGGAGNPDNPDGHKTAYLWERVWQRDAWLDVLARFVHVDKPAKGSKAPATVIFPRYHQWDAVLTLEAATRVEGAGQDYLVEHSAGSGKSNTIAWLAHRLSSLHDAEDRKVFDKVVVITDRRVLDRQLQDTIYQFEHAQGVVQRIDTDSHQLAEALTGEQARIVITTLWKFPVVMQRGIELPDRRYAVIVDEAHSSQTGEAAKDLKAVLGTETQPKATGGEPKAESTIEADEEAALDAAEAAEAGATDEAPDPVADALEAAAKARGKQSNLSFFAFTATPKGRTLEQFGRLDAATKRHEPFHLYSMRQAIEEGFIRDVLESDVTYETYWNIEKRVVEDPAYDPGKAGSAIARFVSLHPHHLAQKAEVIVEHFRRHVRPKIGGRAKAMVVTASRLHAVRYQRALKAYCDEHGYGDLGILVAFSGTVTDGAAQWTEASMNGVAESRTAVVFDSDAYQLLVVAEKYQTGFDQPLLYAMYVDKPLSGLAAVQTLSRLNRIWDGKDGTFVLDFRNDAEDIREAFEPWYGKTVAPPTDPNLLYDTRHALDEFLVLWPEEVEVVAALLVGPDTGDQHAKVHAALGPSITRFEALDEDEQDRFRDALARFVRTYSFLSQVVSFTDAKLERDYQCCKALAMFIRPESRGTIDLGSQVELTHLRLEETFSGSVSLTAQEGEVTTIFSGTGKQYEPAEELLSQIIEELNARFGTRWDPADRVFYDVIAEKLAARPDLQQAAAANTESGFALLLEKEFTSGVVDQLGVSEDMAVTFLDNEDLQRTVLAAYLPLVYSQAKVAHQEHCPIGELLGAGKESQWLEYKATLRTHLDSGSVHKPLETATLKTIAAFLNAREGGTLLLGVRDDGARCGLAADYASLHKDGRDDGDTFMLHLGQIVAASMGAAAATYLSAQMHTVDGHDLCRVHVRPCAFPVTAEVTVERNAQHEKKVAFYVRVGNATKELDETEQAKYMLGRWPGHAAAG